MLLKRDIIGIAESKLVRYTTLSIFTYNCIGHNKTALHKKPDIDPWSKPLTYQGAKLWNSLPEHIKTAESVNKFQILIEKHIV